VNGKWEEHGTLSFPDGSTYSGWFSDNVFNGHGVLMLVNDACYVSNLFHYD
jgi:hypothetical protein